MTTIFDAAARTALAARVPGITAASQRRWGSMNSAQALAHIADALRMALGELEVKGKWTPLRLTPVKQLIIYLAPFPKGAPTAPELLARVPVDCGEECAAIVAMLERCGKPSQAFVPTHPAFGTMSRRDWGVLIYRHTDHHLRQFGA